MPIKCRQNRTNLPPPKSLEFKYQKDSNSLDFFPFFSANSASIKEVAVWSYRVSLAIGSYWSSEHPLDAPQLSVTQVGGTDHNIVARHWIYFSFMQLNIYLELSWSIWTGQKTLENCFLSFWCCTTQLSPHFISPPRFYQEEEGQRKLKKRKDERSFPCLCCSDLFSLFSKFLPVTL